MGKSFKYEHFYEDDFDGMGDNSSSYKKFKKGKNDKKREIQMARKKAQAERDKAMAELSDDSED